MLRFEMGTAHGQAVAEKGLATHARTGGAEFDAAFVLFISIPWFREERHEATLNFFDRRNRSCGPPSARGVL